MTSSHVSPFSLSSPVVSLTPLPASHDHHCQRETTPKHSSTNTVFPTRLFIGAWFILWPTKFPSATASPTKSLKQKITELEKKRRRKKKHE